MTASVRGDLPLGEAQKACGLINRRILGWRRIVPLVSGLGLGLLICLGVSLLHQLGVPAALAVLAAPVLFVLGMVGIRRLCGASTNQALRHRGAPSSHRVSYEVSPEGFRVNSDVAESLYYWTAIDELACSRDHWVVLVLGMGLVAPRRFFATPLDEKEFVQAIFDKLSPEARARSHGAAQFLSLQ